MVRITKEILTWGQRSTSRVWFGRGQQVGSFVPILHHDGTDHQLFAVWSSGAIEFYFQWFAAKQPFSDDALRRKLLDRLNAIPGVAISVEALRRRPSIPLTIFVNPGALTQLLATYDWCIAEIRRAGNVLPDIGSN